MRAGKSKAARAFGREFARNHAGTRAGVPKSWADDLPPEMKVLGENGDLLIVELGDFVEPEYRVL
jgi:hypothetical protein